ncbi:hypothetical protein [Rhizobium sp. SL42]|uniref:hypothetical protein n=1 Tax=Rhizobium sp. SL42 TaxID=2806346 RepID=UPI001F36BBAC|nr:hypothetical protein [Rhizobium sp. SL42]UJW77829.1 hypothetical protein IM739_22910 [Rhizobium sp. SL42]
MRQQTKPFTVERKSSGKLKSDSNWPSTWGKLDLTMQDPHVERVLLEETAAGGDEGRR